MHTWTRLETHNRGGSKVRWTAAATQRATLRGSNKAQSMLRFVEDGRIAQTPVQAVSHPHRHSIGRVLPIPLCDGVLATSIYDAER